MEDGLNTRFLGILLFVISFTNCYTQELIPFSYGGKVGYVDQNLKVTISPKYEHGSTFRDGYAIVQERSESYVIDIQGNILYSTNSNNMYHFGGSFFTAQGNHSSDYDGLYKIIDIDSKEVIADKLREVKCVGQNDNDIFAVTHFDSDVDFSYISDRGERLFRDVPIFSGNPFSQGVATIWIDTGKWEWLFGIIDKEGNIIAQDFERLGNIFSEGLCPALTSDGRTGYIDRNGQLVFEIPLIVSQYIDSENTSFENGRAIIKSEENEGYWSVIDKNGHYIQEFVKVDIAYGFSDGMALVHRYNNGYSYVNTNGEFVFDFIFSKAESFKNGFARVVINDRDAIVDTEGNIYYSSDLIKGSN